MEGNKNAMYAQAGRSFGWKQVDLGGPETKIVAPPHMPEAKIVAPPHVPEVKIVVPPHMPETPPVSVISPIPAPPVVIVPEFEKFEGECQTAAMAYVKPQKWHECYEPEQGFGRGTLFSELDLPFVGEGACRYE